MTPEQYRKLTDLFHQAMERPAAEREDYARQLFGADTTLLPLLLNLIRSAGQSIEGDETPFGRPSDEDSSSSFSPDEILLNRFRIVRFLGRGGMGEVYEANDAETGRVALKTIRPEIAKLPDVLDRFRHEVHCARKVTGANVCRIYEFFSLSAGNGRPATAFLTMEFLEGVTLSERIASGRGISINEAEKIAIEVCQGLKAIHDADIIHRDLKSRNIMLAVRKRGVEAVLMDFGLASEMGQTRVGATHSDSTMPGGVAGTPEYMAPEQFQGAKLTPAADIYALGVVLYEMVTGELPFVAPTLLGSAVERAKPLKRISSIRRDVPHRWDTVTERCLRYAANERFQSAEDVAKVLTNRALWPRAPAASSHAMLAIMGLLLGFIIAFVVWFRAYVASERSEPKRIAVLPFEDLSDNAVDKAFCAGLSEVFVSQLTELEQFHGELSVVPSNEVRHEHIATARDAYRSFGVNLVLTGSVQQSSDGIQVIVNVVDAKNLKQIRSKTMLITAADPVRMQSGIVSEVANLLDMQLNPKAHRLLANGATTVPGAYDYYVQGYGYLRQFGGVQTSDLAIVEFQHALALDPAYALANAGLGEAYWQKYLKTKDPNLLDKAWASCRRALSLNDRIAPAHDTLGLLNAGTGDYRGAITEYQRALAIDPKDRDAFSGMASVYEKTGGIQEAEVTFKQAIAIQPGYWNGYVRLATFYKRHGRYKDALVPLKHVAELVPDNAVVHFDLGGIYQLLGDDHLAETEYQESLKISPSAPGYSDLGSFYYYRHRYADAVHLYSQALELAPASFDYWGNIGDAFRFTGETGKAQQAYGRAIALCQQSIKLDKHDGIAMSSAASYEAKLRNYEVAIALAQQSEKLALGNSDVFYDIAITYELSGQRSKAVIALKKAISLGYSLTIIQQEPDLAALRATPGFTQIVTP